jgi:beta-glucosidase
MKKRIYTLSVILLIMLVNNGITQSNQNIITIESAPLYKNTKAPIEERVEDLLKRMTVEEKIEQLSGGNIIYNIAGITGLVSGSSGFNTPDNERLGIPGLKFTDGPRGVRIGNSTCFAVSESRAASFNTKLESKIGYAMGLEAAANGHNCLLAPCINVVRHPGWGRAQESYGEDTYLLGEMGKAFIEGAQKTVMANAKHYAVNNIENTRQFVNVIIDERTLREVYLPHFEKAVNSKVASVMSSYNRVNGLYVSENEHLLKDILKEDWGFDGFVVSDWFAFKIRPLRALNAGLDVEMPYGISYGPPLDIAKRIGIIPMESLDDSVKRVLRQKFRFGLFDGKVNVDKNIYKTEEHKNLALESSREGIVLLKNKNNLLPLSKNISTIAMFGDAANEARLGDNGSSSVTPDYAVTPYEGIKNKFNGHIILANNNDTTGAVSKADISIIVVGLTGQDEGEFLGLTGGDRTNLNLHREDEDLIKNVCKSANKCIVVMEAGSAIVVEPWIDDVDALIMAWYPGQEGGNAIADVLFGDYNPSGKLPITFGKSKDQYPPLLTNRLRVTYDYYHGYKYFEKNNVEPRYPFGFGLSYTTFEYSNIDIKNNGDEINVTFDIKNTGSREGAEVPQIYVGFENSKIDRPIKELKGFTKINLLPNESKNITIPIRIKDLEYFDTTKNTWALEDIQYNIYVASSYKNIRLKGTLNLD